MLLGQPYCTKWEMGPRSQLDGGRIGLNVSCRGLRVLAQSLFLYKRPVVIKEEETP